MLFFTHFPRTSKDDLSLKKHRPTIEIASAMDVDNLFKVLHEPRHHIFNGLEMSTFTGSKAADWREQEEATR